MNDSRLVIAEKLSKEVGTAPWSLLEVHAQSDHLILVSEQLDLIEAATAIVANESETVMEWIESKWLDKPKLSDWTTFQNTPGLRFQFVIAHPYVLAKTIDLMVPA